MRRAELVGRRFGRLVVTHEEMGIHYGRQLQRRWGCVCDCGERVIVRQSALTVGDTLSCGCLRRERFKGVAKPTGQESPNWMGEEIASYSGMHSRLRRLRGRARDNTCANCEDRAFQWAYRWDAGCEQERIGSKVGGVSNSDLPFCPHVEHYDPMCARCHKAFDLSDARREAA